MFIIPKKQPSAFGIIILLSFIINPKISHVVPFRIVNTEDNKGIIYSFYLLNASFNFYNMLANINMLKNITQLPKLTVLS